ncbi:MAG TPA: response regulator transcription factor [Burkholderiaceae bacterium]|jgi:DNA-binding NarL/FixJ family response regulator
MTKSALIIEDHPIYRDALLTFMCTLVGEANVSAVSTAEEGLAHIKNNDDLGLILLDLGLPGVNGVEAVTSLKRKCKSVEIVVISASEDRREVDAVLRAGARVFVSKAVSTKVIAGVVQKILNGETIESNWIAARGNQISSESDTLALTPRQHETLVCLCLGLSNKEIGMRLGLAEITVKIHISSIFRVLGVANRTQAALAARRLGLYTESQE